jgi:uroporphyrinogen-III synthase
VIIWTGATSRKGTWHFPCVRHEACPTKPLALKQGLVLWTSPRSVLFAKHHDQMKALFTLGFKHYCFGKATEMVLDDATCVEATTAAEWFSILSLPDGSIILPGPKERAFALDVAYQRQGREVWRFDHYQTFSGLFGDVIALKRQQHRHVCFASPTAVRGYLGLDKNVVADTKAYALGKTTFQACQGHFSQLVMSEKASFAALVASVTF